MNEISQIVETLMKQTSLFNATGDYKTLEHLDSELKQKKYSFNAMEKTLNAGA